MSAVMTKRQWYRASTMMYPVYAVYFVLLEWCLLMMFGAISTGAQDIFAMMWILVFAGTAIVHTFMENSPLRCLYRKVRDGVSNDYY